MNTNDVVNDELNTGQTNAFVWQLGKIKSQLRVTNVHHDFYRNLRQFAQITRGDFIFLSTAVDVTCIPFSTGNGNDFAFSQGFSGITTTHNGWNTEFARNNGRMTGATPTIGNNGRSPLHHRFPVRVGHIRYQYITCLNGVHQRRIVNNPYRTHANLLANGSTGCKHLTVGLQRKLLDLVFGFL